MSEVLNSVSSCFRLRPAKCHVTPGSVSSVLATSSTHSATITRAGPSSPDDNRGESLSKHGMFAKLIRPLGRGCLLLNQPGYDLSRSHTLLLNSQSSGNCSSPQTQSVNVNAENVNKRRHANSSHGKPRHTVNPDTLGIVFARTTIWQATFAFFCHREHGAHRAMRRDRCDSHSSFCPHDKFCIAGHGRRRCRVQSCLRRRPRSTAHRRRRADERPHPREVCQAP